MLLSLALIVSGSGVTSLLLWFIGVVIVFCLVWFVMKTLEAPPIAFKMLLVVAAIIAILITADFFFGESPGRHGTIIVK